MSAREFFEAIIKNMPSRGLDNVDIYVDEEINEEESVGYEIIDISNNGSNDCLTIIIKKI